MQYIVQRLGASSLALVGLSIIVFSLIRFIPGDAALIASGSQGLGVETTDPEVLEALRHELGLDKPAITQYVVWVGRLVRADFGTSFVTRRSTMTQLREAIPPTIEVATLTILIAVITAIPIGVLSAVYRDSLADFLMRGFAVMGLAVPAFVVAVFIVVFPAIWFGWSPPARYQPVYEAPLQNLQITFPAAAAVGWTLSASIARMTRTTVLDVLSHDYVRTARAKGLSERVVLSRHVLRNGLIPVVTIIGLQVAAVLGGIVIVELIFNIPGVGRLTLIAVRNRDYPQIQLNVLFLGAIVVFANLLVDLSYAVIDPRIRSAR